MSNLSEEEKYAIKELTEIKELVEEDLQYAHYEVTATLNKIDLKSLVIVLNLLEKQQKELDKKDKIMIKMARVIKSGGRLYGVRSSQGVIEYFTKQVEGEKDE